MLVKTSVKETREAVSAARGRGLTVGLVPTMGYLHEGHLALVRQARSECGFVVVSVFVNPLQFGPREDFRTYPRDLQRDLSACERTGADLVFHPAAEEIYPPRFSTHVEVAGLSSVLCGASRPTHFRGVATIVTKLLNIVRPDRAYFGRKDYQQTVVVRRMVTDLDLGVEVVVVPTVRHEDGLAMSSRNAYLNRSERRAATVLYKALDLASERTAAGQTDGVALCAELEEYLEAEPLARVDYVAVADPETLQPLERLSGTFLVALAVYIGSTRLIDNRLITAPEQGGRRTGAETCPCRDT